jgi:hypothetical protein
MYVEKRYLIFCYVVMILLVGGCSILDMGKLSPPSEAYWGKSGYSLLQTRKFMYEVCGFKQQYNTNDEYYRVRPALQICMLDHGFLYMTDFHKITKKGYLPLSYDICDKNSPPSLYNTPACKSYRGEAYK